MKQHIANLLKQAIQALQELEQLPKELNYQLQIEQTKNPAHGELACNIALVLSKQAQRKPRQLAVLICETLAHSEHIAKTEIAGPGFINFFLNADSQHSIITDIIEQQALFGQHQHGAGKTLQIEFVSANPTGPLHVGHGRGAAYGACVANLLSACGYQVEREYYVNDAGRQMDILATSIWLRYLQHQGLEFDFPSNGYQGDYIIQYAQQLNQQLTAQHRSLLVDQQHLFANVSADQKAGGDKEQHIDDLINNAKRLLKDDYSIVFELGLKAILDDIQQDLHKFGVNFDRWFSERSLLKFGPKNENLVETVIAKLAAKNLLQQREGHLWFLSTQFGDDKDRVIRRSNGQTTYFASDIAYHYEKFQRGYDRVINVWGADHHGYIKRVQAALQALDIDASKLDIKLVQFVSLYRGKQQLAMSTRSGEFVTLKALREEVGTDAARFFYVMRKAEQATDFDLELAKRQSQDNPVYYVQYAHARICSMLDKMRDEGISFNQVQALQHLELLDNSHEKQLMKKLSAYPELVLKAALAAEPHLIVNYLRELAADYHSYYNAHKVITSHTSLTQARAALSIAVKHVLANALRLLDISQPEKM